MKQPPPLVLPTEDEHDEISYERAVSSSSPSSSLNMLQPPQTALESVSEFALEKLGALTFRNRERGGAIGSMRMHFHTMERARSFWIDLASRMPATSYMLDCKVTFMMYDVRSRTMYLAARIR